MSQAEELLNSLSETFPEHTHAVTDSDNYFVIDPVTRTIKNMTNGPLVIMQRDHKSTVYTFQLPRYIEGHDMSLCNRVKCHFNNVENNEEDDSLIEHADVAELTDLRVNPKDRNTVICSWTITRQATQYAGALGFFIQYLCIDNEGNETYEWHTDEFVEVIIKKTRHNDEQPLVEYTAIFEQWRERIFGAGDSVKSELIALTEEKLSEVTSEGTKQVENVANEGLRVLGTIPEDYTAMSEQVDILSRFAGPVIRQEVEGESIIVKDSAKMPLLGLQMFGNSSQFTTTGKNWLNLDGLVTISNNGVTATIMRDDMGNLKYISVSGTATSTFILVAHKFNIMAGTYMFSNFPNRSVEDGTLHAQLCDSNGGLLYPVDNGLGGEHTFEEDRELMYRIYIAEGRIASDERIYPMLRDISIDDSTYEPYTGGQASPNPEYPQEIASVENPTLTIRGKNMLRESAIPATTNGNGITCDYEGNGIFHIYGTHTCETQEIQLAGTSLYMDIDPDAYYTLSVEVIEGAIPSKFHPFLGVGSENVTFRNWFSVPLLAETSVGTIVSDTRQPSSVMNDVTQVTRFWIYNYNSDLTSYTADFRIRVWLEQSEVSTSFESFTEQNMISTMTLPGLPVTSGGNYTDENGQQYIANYRDWERGVDVQRINTIQLWSGFVINESTNETWIQLSDNIAAAEVTGAVQCLCTHFPGDSRQNVYDRAFEENYRGICARDRFVRIVDNVNFKANPEALNAWIDEKSAAGVPVMLTYILNKPIETAIPEAELQAYRELHTNYSNTTILNDSGAYMKLAYATDTKMYIDNKFAELQALIKES